MKTTESRPSNVSSLFELAQAVYIDACAKCVTVSSDLRDLETIRSRVSDEGLSFLTITLPRFCQDFERSLADGIIDPSAFPGFRKAGAIPAFLQGMLGRIFDRENGRIYDTFNRPFDERAASDIPVIVDSVRQICRTFAKIQVDCTRKRTQKALDSFVTVEQSFSEFSLQKRDFSRFATVSSLLWDVMVSKISLSNCVPRHGPGATAEGVSGNQKYLWREWHERLEPYFPIVGYGYPLGLPADAKELEIVSFMSTERERPVKVTPVPKTLKGPRIIAIEPCCVQFVQQGLSRAIVRALESSWLVSGHVNFRDQRVNQRLAMSASATGQLATIDLSDASDRVPRSLALRMFRSNPDLRDAIEACRSRSALLPDGRLVRPLRKFASMGSALCFPIESMYFYTICVAALMEAQDLPLTMSSAIRCARLVYVYGDDIVVPSAYVTAVIDNLQKYNCKVNSSKSFWTGKFRESCGVDAYNGELVTPVYIRRTRPYDRRQAKEILSWVATSNLFYLKGYWRTTTLMRKHLDKIVGPLPYVSATSPALGYRSFLGYETAERWNNSFQRFEVRAWIPSPIYRAGKMENYSALSKSLTDLEGRTDLSEPRDKFALQRFALHGAVKLKRRWVPATN